MVKKVIMMAAVAFLFMTGAFGLSQANAQAPAQMVSTLQKQYKSAHYDYKEGTFQLEHVKTYNLSSPITVQDPATGKKVQVNKVIAAVASFKTVRDYIFYKDWNDYAFYAPETHQVLSLGDVSKVKALQDYQNTYKSSVSLELGPILLIMASLLIIPFIILIVWSKKRYSVLDYKLNNNMLNDPKH